MTELPIILGIDVLFLVVGPFQLDGMGGPVGGFVPAANAHGQVSLHVESMRDAGRGMHIRFRMLPAERGPANVFVMMNQLVIGAGVQRIEFVKRLVIWDRCVRSLGKLSAVEPALFVILEQSQQLIEALGGFLTAFIGRDAFKYPLFLQSGSDQERFGMARF